MRLKLTAIQIYFNIGFTEVGINVKLRCGAEGIAEDHKHDRCDGARPTGQQLLKRHSQRWLLRNTQSDARWLDNVKRCTLLVNKPRARARWAGPGKLYRRACSDTLAWLASRPNMAWM